MRHIIAAVFASAAFSLPAHAVTFATDATDLWSKPDEPGWGVNVVQQAEVLFITFFIYDASGKPTWYVGSDVRFTSSQNGLEYSGALYQTTGPYFGGTFSAANVRQVGTVTFTLDTISSARISFVADGVSFSKGVTRQWWRYNNLSGGYVGASVGTWTGCPTNGYAEEEMSLTVTHDSSFIRMVMVQPSGTCTFTGTYTQSGRMGSVSNGTVSCSDGTAGTFSASEIEGSVVAVTGRAVTQYGSCRWLGRFGGLRRGS